MKKVINQWEKEATDVDALGGTQATRINSKNATIVVRMERFLQ